MSQLVSAVMARDTGNRKIVDDRYSQLFQDVFSKVERSVEIMGPLVAKVYRIGVELGVETQVTETQEDELSDAIIRAKRSIIEACFGEFRNLPIFSR